MIPGVHASIVVARSPGEVRAALDRPGWPWLGKPGAAATREVGLGGRPMHTLQLRAFANHGGGRHGSMWRVRLEHRDTAMSPDPLLDLHLWIEPLEAGATRLVVDGRATPDLVTSGTLAPSAVVRLTANALVRSLLEQIASTLEVHATWRAVADGPPPRGAAAIRALAAVHVRPQRRD